MDLHAIDPEYLTKKRTQRKRKRLIIDNIISIPSEKMKKHQANSQDIMRCLVIFFLSIFHLWNLSIFKDHS